MSLTIVTTMGDSRKLSLFQRWSVIINCLLLLPRVSSGSPNAVLMLGDSYTSTNGGLDRILAKLLSSAGDTREVKALTSGGKDFAWHAKQVKMAGSPHEAALGKNGPSWGLVVLQDQSHVPAFCCNGPQTEFYGDFAKSIDAVQDLDHFAQKHGARTVLLQTWGRLNGAPVPFLNGFEQMNDLVIRGYDMYAAKINHTKRSPLVVPVGSAFSLIYNDIAAPGSREEAEGTDNLWHQLYAGDGSHPSAAGSYLAACMLYATITGKSPVGLVSITDVTAAQAKALQQKAHEAIFANGTAASSLRDLEGSYSSDEDGGKGLVAQIHDGFVVWPVGIRTPLRRSGKQLQMNFHGEKYTGSVTNGLISWSDGDIWRRTPSAGKLSAFAQSSERRKGLARREETHRSGQDVQDVNTRRLGNKASPSARRAVHINPAGQQSHTPNA